MANLPITIDTLNQLKLNITRLLEEEEKAYKYVYTMTPNATSLQKREERIEEFKIMIVNINNSLKEINNLK